MEQSDQAVPGEDRFLASASTPWKRLKGTVWEVNPRDPSSLFPHSQ